MKVDVIEQKNLSELKPSIPQVQCHQNTNSGQFVIPWISRVFDAIGLVSIATGIVTFCYQIINIQTNWEPNLFIWLLFSGFVYVAIAVILRAVSESAFNTQMLVKIKLNELDK